MISTESLWKIWLIMNPRPILIALFGFLLVLALGIHLILLSTADFNWIEDGIPAKSAVSQMQVTPVVPQRQ
ncbi:MAG: light-harvesting protein [Thiocapsa sp.]|uniref:light-harvesting antenna LH1, alpha subunit n=1 Tax=Thiocapsa sp. TaxID=2024551 RepID=UPI001BCB3C51|nr:light-harvesting antenna LH1, alpha subunit [Thiocapsa sp.]QVL46705.1 MAG: light-harvesting protein [Thiocapsa sp.]